MTKDLRYMYPNGRNAECARCGKTTWLGIPDFVYCVPCIKQMNMEKNPLIYCCKTLEDFVSGGKGIKYDWFDLHFDVTTLIGYDESDGFTLSYCPFCGRKV